MKTRNLLTVAFLSMSALTFAQRSHTYNPVIRQDIQLNFDKAIDTVNIPAPAAACVPNLAVGLLNLGTDQVSGTNSFGDKEKAQFFRYAGGGDITGVDVLFGFKKPGAANGTTNYNVKLYASTMGGPGTFLGSSQQVAYTLIDTTSANGITHFGFTTPVAVIDSFFASVVVDPGTPGTDTVAVYMLFDGTNPSNTCGQNTAWERQGDNTWHMMNGTAQVEWGVDVEFLILPIISTGPLGTDEPSPLTTHRMYPNPASDMTSLSYTLNTMSDVKISIMDMNGRTVYTKLMPNQYSGVYNQTIDVNGFASGLYSYAIETSGYTTTGKFLVK